MTLSNCTIQRHSQDVTVQNLAISSPYVLCLSKILLFLWFPLYAITWPVCFALQCSNASFSLSLVIIIFVCELIPANGGKDRANAQINLETGIAPTVSFLVYSIRHLGNSPLYRTVSLLETLEENENTVRGWFWAITKEATANLTQV